jgi:hypothetical protein
MKFLGFGPSDEELFSPKLYSTPTGCTFLPNGMAAKKVSEC